MHEDFTYALRTAYFSMEIALRPEIPTYSGGLGILAGDTVRSATDLNLPLVAVSLVSRAGYFRQERSTAAADKSSGRICGIRAAGRLATAATLPTAKTPMRYISSSSK